MHRKTSFIKIVYKWQKKVHTSDAPNALLSAVGFCFFSRLWYTAGCN